MSCEIHNFNNKYSNRFSDRTIVFGSGCCPSQLMLIGEAPGKDEIRLQKPFVGSAGKNLQSFLDILGLKRDSIYITNAIKYRLSKISEKSGREINRPATKDDINLNRAFLLEEVEIIKPDIIVTLGNVPLRSITGDFNMNIGQCHGTMIDVIINNEKYNLFPLYHPASIIYNRKLYQTYIDDLIMLKEAMARIKHL